MYQAGIQIRHVNPVFITHHHFDHINDLFDVIISTAMAGREETLHVYGPAETQRIVSALLNEVYAQDIRFRLEEDKAMRKAGGSWGERPEAIADVNVTEVESGLVAQSDNWKVFTERIVHGDFAHVPDFDWRCLGYRIEAEGRVVTISGDTVKCEGLLKLARGADLLIQACHIPKRLAGTAEMKFLTNSILPSSGEVGSIAAEARVKRMVLTHLSASINGNNAAEIEADVRADFDGDLQLGHDLMEITI